MEACAGWGALAGLPVGDGVAGYVQVLGELCLGPSERVPKLADAIRGPFVIHS